MMTFKDHFSKLAVQYARFRPQYPPRLFAWLASLTPEQELAWDCGAGNGQATVALAPFFQHVIATEPSAEQLAYAIPHERVEYRRCPAETTDLDDHSVDLVTAAQAAHWFDFERFYPEVRRVVKPRGVVAFWCYHLLTAGPEIDAAIRRFYDETLGPYWPFDRKLVEGGYRTIDFPFEEIASPDWTMEAFWNLDELLGYLRTWSATQRYVDDRGVDPVIELDAELAPHWSQRNIRKRVRWPLHLRVGRG